MFIKSIRFKVTIVFMIILAITLALFSTILYKYVSRNLNDHMDTLLRAKGEDVAHGLSAYWTAERLGSRRYGMQQEDYESNAYDYVDFKTIAQKWVEGRSRDRKLIDLIVQIFDTDGSIVAATKYTQGMAEVSKENFAIALSGKACFDTVAASYPTKKSVNWRVFILPLIQDNKVQYIVQVASPLTAIEMALNSLRMTLLLLIPATVLLMSMAGGFIVKLTLHPVDKMINEIHDIRAENLKSKIAVPATRDEIEKLAQTFNDMLGRLDHAFTSQKHLFEDLSHELKTPLAIIKGEFEVALKKIRTPEEYGAILSSSLEEVDRITKIVENLLLLASFEAKKITPTMKSLDLNLLVQGVVNSIKKLALQKEISVEVVQKDENIILLADEQQLKRLFLNLLDNAVKYTPAKGSIIVEVSRDKGLALVSVKDTGTGIRSEDLGHIFERFYRVGSSGSGKGFGLGLGIARAIVDSHNGSISVESVPGQGAAFHVRLPV